MTGRTERACRSSVRLLDRALREAGIEPSSVFRTNTVKHFRFDPGRAGKRIHKGPSRMHVTACGPWLAAELDLVRPRGVVHRLAP